MILLLKIQIDQGAIITYTPPQENKEKGKAAGRAKKGHSNQYFIGDMLYYFNPATNQLIDQNGNKHELNTGKNAGKNNKGKGKGKQTQTPWNVEVWTPAPTVTLRPKIPVPPTNTQKWVDYTNDWSNKSDKKSEWANDWKNDWSSWSNKREVEHATGPPAKKPSREPRLDWP